MKNKKIIALLIVLALIQLIFPLSFVAKERKAMEAVIEKGTDYTLEFTAFNYFSAEYINLNTDSLYTVGYKWDGNDYGMGEYYMPHDTLSVFRIVGIRQDEKGELDFFDAESCDKALLTKDNWFDTAYSFRLSLKDYEFASDDLNLESLFDLSMKLGEAYDELDFEIFTQKKDGYYDGIFDIPIEGKITLKVYNGHAKITELFIGDELVLKHK